VADSSVELLKSHLAKVTELKEAGRATDLELARTEARYAEARAQAEEIRGHEQVAQLTFNMLLGLPSDTVVVPSLESLTKESVAIDDSSAQRLDAQAMADRPEVRAARKRVNLAELQARAAGAAMLPSLSLQAGYTMANPNDRYFPPPGNLTTPGMFPWFCHGMCGIGAFI
jgi:outer membrane protein TolC